mmetsp:Transcript_83/g.318  ORF Transcript_83/g.318 Transcript_83/m.318 type:complete len:243 (+) Transcript_83:1247-1975(+)
MRLAADAVAILLGERMGLVARPHVDVAEVDRGVEFLEMRLQHVDVLLRRFVDVETPSREPADDLSLAQAPRVGPRELGIDSLLEAARHVGGVVEHGVGQGEERERRREDGGFGVEVVDDGAAVEGQREPRVAHERVDRRRREIEQRRRRRGVLAAPQSLEEGRLERALGVVDVRVDLDDEGHAALGAKHRRLLEEREQRDVRELGDREVVGFQCPARTRVAMKTRHAASSYASWTRALSVRR